MHIITSAILTNTNPFLRLYETVFNCYSPFEKRKDYKEVFLTMWVNYIYLNTSFVGQYFNADCDIIAITMQH